MAFATARTKTLGLGAGLKMTVGEWSNSAGDTNGSLTIEAAALYLAEFRTAQAAPIPVNIAQTDSVSGRIATITVGHGPNATTAGRFVLIYA